MDHSLPDYLLTLDFLVRAAVPLTVLAAIWIAVRRADLPREEQVRTGAIISAVLLAWFGVAWWLGAAHAFVGGAEDLPRIQYAIVLPIAAGLALMLGTQRGSAVVAAAPQAWLVGLQVYRAVGAMFLMLWADGRMPGEFAVPAGTGDVIVGVTAPFVAWLNAKELPAAATVTRAWNVFGIADLVVAVATGFLSSPSPLQMLAFDRPNLLITEYPLVMVPIFLVPLSIILHGLSLWKIARGAGGQLSGARRPA